MIVMPASACGWLWHSLARETSCIGHLYSPGDQRGPWPWIPYALDNGAFSCWTQKTNTFDHAKWANKEYAWRTLIMWAQTVPIKPLWAIVPDVPGNGLATLNKWEEFAPEVVSANIPIALAVQDGITPEVVLKMAIRPDVICVGGTDAYKEATTEAWAKEFPRVHYLRCNSVYKLNWLESLGVESCDGTGWNRGDRHIRTRGLEEWCRARAVPTSIPLWPHACRAAKDKKQLAFA